MIATKKGLMLMLIFAILWVVASVNSATNPATTWYLYNTSISGATPAGHILQSFNSDMTGWQPTQTITASPLYWYSDTQTAAYNPGDWQFILWTASPPGAAVINVGIYTTDADGGNATLIAEQQLDVKNTGTGNHPSTYNFQGIAAVSLTNRRLMVKINKVSGVDVMMAYNTNDFPSRLLTPPLGSGSTFTPDSTATIAPTPTVTADGTTPTPDANFWDRSNIPAANNVMTYKFLNRTYGKYTDSQIYWSFNGQTHSLAEQNYIYDFIEHTIGNNVWNGNTHPGRCLGTSHRPAAALCGRLRGGTRR